MRIVVLMTIALSMMMAKGTIVTPENNTSLVWEDSLHNTEEKVTHSEAGEYCKALKLGVFTDWRLPTLSELLTIVDYNSYKPAISKAFKHTDDDTLYWSSTPYSGTSGDFWGVNFKDGSTDNASAIYDRHIRCVRTVK